MRKREGEIDLNSSAGEYLVKMSVNSVGMEKGGNPSAGENARTRRYIYGVSMFSNRVLHFTDIRMAVSDLQFGVVRLLSCPSKKSSLGWFRVLLGSSDDLYHVWINETDRNTALRHNNAFVGTPPTKITVRELIDMWEDEK